MTKWFTAMMVAAVMLTTFNVALATDAGPMDAGVALIEPAVPEAPSLGEGKTPEKVADDAVGVAEDPLGALGQLYKMGRAGDWWGVFAVALSLMIWGGRWLFRNSAKFKKYVLGSRLGSVLFTGFMSFLGMLTTRMLATATGDVPLGAPDGGDLKAAFLFAGLSIASWHGLIKPLVGWVRSKV